METLEGRVVRALGRLHDARPRQSTIRQSHILVELPDLPEAAIHSLLDRLRQKGTVIADGSSIALEGRKPRLSHTEKALKEQAERAIAEGGYQPPDLTALQEQAGARASVLPDLLTLLVEEGRIVEINKDLYLSAETEADLRGRVQERLRTGNGLTMAELRDLLATTRRFAVPIGEYLDRIGLTRREGDLRFPGEAFPGPPSEPREPAPAKDTP